MHKKTRCCKFDLFKNVPGQLQRKMQLNKDTWQSFCRKKRHWQCIISHSPSLISPSVVTKMLAPLMSRWILPVPCKYAKPCWKTWEVVSVLPSFQFNHSPCHLFYIPFFQENLRIWKKLKITREFYLTLFAFLLSTLLYARRKSYASFLLIKLSLNLWNYQEYLPFKSWRWLWEISEWGKCCSRQKLK